MCGIAGFLKREGEAQVATITAMCLAIQHRGPDDQGIYVDGPCAIGMRRLSIIDLSTGHQPISNEDGSIWVVFNGEIYNYRALRKALEGEGHRFVTTSDTEVLVHLYEQHGTGGLARLRGMFAFAIWDSRRHRLLLARDRFGKKPLYYAIRPEGVYFASELKSLRVAGLPLEIDHEALRLYFAFKYIPDPRTIFRGVQRLPAGSWLTYDGEAKQERGKYWTAPVPTDVPGSETEEEVCERVRDAFDDAVNVRLVADVPVGAFLSGGIDSSSVVASMALQSSEPVRTFSIGFEEQAFNELHYARLVAEKYRTEHHEIVVQPDSVALVQRLVQQFDEPFADSSAIPTFVVSEFAARHVKVVLSGDGGDELFGGYDSFMEVERRRIFDKVPLPLRRAVSHVADWLPYATYGKNYLRMLSRPSSLERYFESNYTPYFLREAMLRPEWMLQTDDDSLRSLFADCLPSNGADILTQAMYFETTANLVGDMLFKVDRMSMANSLEVRCPLLDHELAELAASIPPRMKIQEGRGKHILLRALGDRLPSSLLTRRKMGFGVPLATWFRGPLREMLVDSLTGKTFAQRGLARPGFVNRLIQEHLSERRDNSAILWALLVLELWFTSSEATL